MIDLSTVTSDEAILEISESELPPLIFAAANGDLNLIQDLLQTTSVDINQKGPRGWTALTFAAAMRHFEVVKYLISQGARIIKTDHESFHALAQAMHEIWPCRRQSLQFGD